LTAFFFNNVTAKSVAEVVVTNPLYRTINTCNSGAE
jgi:hypothetical protein